MNLETVRRRIDRIDADLLNLLERRMELALETARFKPAVADPVRERRIVARLEARASKSGLLAPGFIAVIYALIFEQSRKNQGSPPAERKRASGPGKENRP